MKKESLSSGNAPFRILSLDGGGAKGFYTLGILAEIEAMLGQPVSGEIIIKQPRAAQIGHAPIHG